MWRTSYCRFSSKSQCIKCRQFFSSTRLQQNEVNAKPPQTPSPPPPPAQKSGGGVFFKLLGLTTLTAGGVVGYAWYDKNFRKTIEDNVPYTKEGFEFIFSYLPKPEEVKQQTNQLKELPSQLPFSKVSKEAPEPPPQKPKTKSVPAPIEKKADPIVEQKLDPSAEKDRKKRETERKLKEKEIEEAAENAALEVVLENLVETLSGVSEKAVSLQNHVMETTRKHTEQLKKAMEDTSDILQKDLQWEEVARLFDNREEAKKEAEKVVNNARENLEKLKAAIDEGKQNVITKKNKTIIAAQETANKVAAQLSKTASQVSKAEAEGNVLSRYKDLVEKGRKQFQKELESLMPDVKLGDKKGKKLTEDELNSLIAHAHRRIEQLQKQIAEQLALEQQHIQQALEHQMVEDETLATVRVKMEADRMLDHFKLEKEKWDAESQVEFEKMLRQQLARQAAAHSDHLKDVLKVQQEELGKQFEREMHTQLLEERQTFQTEVAGWIARLKGIESAVDSRAEAEKIARDAQELWLSCIALNGAIRLGHEEGVTWEDKLKPLANEIVAISDASGHHPFVETVIRTIPEDALTRGVWTEESLQERFTKVKRICKRVAMIDDAGGSLFKYFLSYLQSFFIFDTIYAKSVEDKIDLDDFDTFAVLSHADYYVKKGEIEQAIKLLNQLRGEPKRVASDWMREAKLMCETRQAAYALMAFASATGLGTLF